MYNEYFGLREKPFSIAPDPRYLYMSEQHKEALAHLLYGIKSDGGFVLLTGEVGTGKTTVCRCLLEQIPEECDLAFILNPRLTVDELLSTICDEFGIRYPKDNKSIKVFIDRINAYLLDSHSKGRKAVLIIDEAQNLTTDVLEQMRLLTNLETNQRKLLQIIMLGQPELRDILHRPELRQLAQRVVARYHLEALSEQEVAAYVNHRLAVAGLRNQLFPPSLISRLFRLSGGIPRLINIICDRALLGTYVQGKEKVDRATLSKAAREVFGELEAHERPSRKIPAWTLALFWLAGAGTILSATYFSHIPQFLASYVLPGAAQQQRMDAAGFRKPIPEGNKSEAAQMEPTPSIEDRNSAQMAEVLQKSQETGNIPLQQKASQQKDLEPVVQAAGEISDKESHSEGTKLDEESHGLDQAMENLLLAKLQWPAGKPISRSEVMAYQALFKKWGASYDPQNAETTCRQAELQGLRCLTAQGGLDDVRRFNRPAVLKLFDARGQEFHATLVELEDRAAMMIVGDETVRVSLDEIAIRWRGDYSLLWRPPPRYQGRIQIGDHGPLIEWLALQLAVAQGRPDPVAEKAVFDEAMIEEIKKFQLASGLRPDGIVGPQTMIRLDSVSSPEVPLLYKQEKDN